MKITINIKYKIKLLQYMNRSGYNYMNIRLFSNTTVKINNSTKKDLYRIKPNLYISPILINKVRCFTVTSFVLMKPDPDLILAKAIADKQRWEGLLKSIEKEKADRKELSTAPAEKNFLDTAKERIDKLMNKQEAAEDNLIDRINSGYIQLSRDKSGPILDKFEDRRVKVKDDGYKKAKALEAEFEDQLKPVAYFTKKVDIEASIFKKYVQILEKEEEEIDKELKKENYINKDKYEKERSEWKANHIDTVKECRQEKQNIKTMVSSNLEKPSEMAEDLVNELGSDYTGGDD